VPAFLDAPPMGRLRRFISTFTDELLADWRLRRQLRAAAPAELATLAESSFARLTGAVRPTGKRLLEAPLSGRPCVYYAIHVISASGPSPRHSHTEIGSEQEAMAFLLDDSTGRAVIDPDHARFSVGFDHVSESKAAFDADPRQRAVLDRFGLVHRDWFGTEHLIYREGVLELDERISVLGAGVREPDPDAAPTGMYRDGPPTRMRFTGTARYPLVISDDPRSLSP